MSSDKLSFILYDDDTTLHVNATVESFGETAADISLNVYCRLVVHTLSYER